MLRFRSEAIAALTRFFAARNFVQIHPPVITSSDCEGAGEVFTVSAGSKTPSHSPAEGEQAGSQTTDPAAREAGENSTNAQQQSSSEPPFFRTPKYLTVSNQLHLEALAQSVGNVWALAPAFRAERSDTSRHLAEFYMLEAEVVFVENTEELISLTEEMIKHMVRVIQPMALASEILHRSHHSRQKFPDMASEEEVQRRWQGIIATEKWPRITYTEAVEVLKMAQVEGKANFEHYPKWGESLQTEHEKYIAQYVNDSLQKQENQPGGYIPVFITNYPRNIKAFYMLPSHSAPGEGMSTVDCFDLIVPEFCEIAGGSMRIHEFSELLEAMEMHNVISREESHAIRVLYGQNNNEISNNTSQVTGKEEFDRMYGIGSEEDIQNLSTVAQRCKLSWYVELRRWGCPPHGGFGLGFDRLLCYLAGVQTVKDGVAFPRWYGRCDC